MFKLLVILDIIKFYVQVNINCQLILNLPFFEDLNLFKSHMIAIDNSDARLFLISGTYHLT